MTLTHHIPKFVQKASLKNALYSECGVTGVLISFLLLLKNIDGECTLELPHGGILISTSQPTIGEKIRQLSQFFIQKCHF